MLKEVTGNVWKMLDKNSAVCILTNNSIYRTIDSFTLKTKTFNPMGGGIAKEAKDRNYGLEERHAQAILNNYYSLGKDQITGAEMLRFPTKENIKENSTLSIIACSLYKVKEYCISNPEITVYLPRPGCGLGGLNWEEVKPVCEQILEDINNIIIVSF